jgi:hypothetical protein
MRLVELLTRVVPAARIVGVTIGPHWTCVEVELEDSGVRRCGLSSSIGPADAAADAAVPRASATGDAGDTGVVGLPVSTVLPHIGDTRKPRAASVAVAAVNAALPDPPDAAERNAEEELAVLGAGRHVAMVGHFPFVSRLRRRVGRLDVIERRPRAGDHPESAAADIIPAADVVAITSMTIENGSIDGLLALCSPQAAVMLLGPSTPLTPAVFEAGVDILSGTIVTSCDGVRAAVPAAGSLKAIKHAGVRLVSMRRADFRG